MENKALTTKKYVDSTYLAKSGFTKEAIANLLFPTGFEFITTSASFDPNTAWGGTWTKKEITVNSSIIYSDYDCSISGNVFKGSATNDGYYPIFMGLYCNFSETQVMWCEEGINCSLGSISIKGFNNQKATWIKFKVAWVKRDLQYKWIKK